MIDNPTLLIAITFSSGALMLTLVLSWLNARRDSYLISWAAGAAFVILSLAAYGSRYGRYDGWVLTGSFAAMISGMALIHIGTCQFRSGSVRLLPIVLLWVVSTLATVVPLLLGLSGVGTAMLNLACAAYLILSGYQYWAGRSEAPLPLVSGAFLFVLTGVSLLACAAMLALDGRAVLIAPPDNWAEQFASIMSIVALTGIGALSVTLGQSRAARHHQLEAQTDALTGLLNRRAILDRFDNAELPISTAVLMFDIDHFKRINDHFGHAAGDAVIRHFAAILQQNLRGEGSVARIGGEEFCAVLQPMAVDQAKRIAECVRAAFEAATMPLSSETIQATVSVGVATSGLGEAFASVLHCADDALYAAKAAGRNRVHAPAARLAA